MNRILALLVILLVADIAIADLPPPPPPKGKKYVSVGNEVLLGKDVTGYVFVQEYGKGPGRPTFTYSKLELSTDKAVRMSEAGRYTYVSLIAVPQDAAKEFKTDKELLDAIKERKVKGAQRIGFNGTATVSDKVKGNSVMWKYTITGIDEKGIKTKVEGEGYESPADKKEEKNESKPEKPLSQYGTGTLVAGVAATLALMLGGLWLAGRVRRKV